MSGRGRIDVHAHYVPDGYRAALEAAGHDRPDGFPLIPAWSADEHVRVMDRLGIETSLLSVSSPGVHLGNGHDAAGLAREVNEVGRRAVVDHPGRFGLLASLPLPDVDATMAEIAHCVDELDVDGFVLLTNTGGTYVSDPSFAPVFRELDRRHARVLLHPTSPACWEHTSFGRPRPMIEFLFDTTRTVVDLVLNGTVAGNPGLELIVPHAGATLPLIADRVHAFAALLGVDPSVDVLRDLARLHYDLAGNAVPRPLDALLTLTTRGHLHYGSDHPFTPEPVAAAAAARIDGLAHLPAAELRANTERLFPTLGGSGRRPPREERTMDHLELGYLVLELPDPDLLTPVLSEVVGLVPGAPVPAGTSWRNDGRAHRVLVTPGPAGDAVAIGIEAGDDDGFDAAVARLRAIAAEVVEGTDDDRSARRVGRLARTRAPWGIDVELVLRLADADADADGESGTDARPEVDPGTEAAAGDRTSGPDAGTASRFSSELVPGGFLTDGVGFGHVVFATTAFDESHVFLTEGLGFRQSDWLEMELAPGLPLEVRFYHCNRRHHTIALARAPFDLPQALHHVMFEVNERDDVGGAFDRALAAGLPIPNGLGRHDNDGMFSFYLQTPAGFQIEVGHGAKVITDGWDGNRRYDRISAWGHQPLPPGA